ncbi:hypothetical protein ACLEQD_42370, partial [Corallococcus sp. 4LFB]
AEGGWLIIAGTEERISPSALDVVAEGATVAPVAPERARYTVRPRAKATEVSVTVRWKDAPSEDAVRLQGAVKPAAPRAEPRVLIPADAHPYPGLGGWIPISRLPSLFLLGGAAFASGANGGPLLGLGVSVPLPVWRRRVAAEAELGLRHASLDGHQEATQVHSRVWGMPLLLSARVTLFQRGSFQLDGRAGGGVLALSHHLSTQGIGAGDVFPAAVDERRVRAMGFLAAQGAYQLGRWSLLTEVRGALAPVETPSLRAELGGLSVSAGLRFVP